MGVSEAGTFRKSFEREWVLSQALKNWKDYEGREVEERRISSKFVEMGLTLTWVQITEFLQLYKFVCWVGRTLFAAIYKRGS